MNAIARRMKTAEPSESAPNIVHSDRTRRLSDINAQLLKYRLQPLRDLGDADRKEFEILGFAGIYPNDYYAIVNFHVRRPNGSTGFYYMKFAVDGDQHRGIATVCVIQDPTDETDHVVFIRQQRPTMLTRTDESPWRTEIPRAFSKTVGEPTILDKKLQSAFLRTPGNMREPISVIGHELTPLFRDDLTEIEEVHLLSDAVPEDTGMSTGTVDTWLIRLRAKDMKAILALPKNPMVKMEIIPLKTVMEQREALGITDLHSKAVLLDLYEHLNCITL